VEQAGRHSHDVEPHVGKEIGNFKRVNQIGITRVAHLALVLEGGEDVGPPQQLEVRLGAVGSDFLEEGLEPNHGSRCLKTGEAPLLMVPEWPKPLNPGQYS
jgi:hypothetical protein